MLPPTKSFWSSPAALVIGLLCLGLAAFLHFGMGAPAREFRVSAQDGFSMSFVRGFDWRQVAWPLWGIGGLLVLLFGIMRFTARK